ncbi:hypothetical protein ACIBI9_20195 [Nonomuraea sp. NPDC050451]|uniref:hypothetical protein n=1 Tax=Nonomuraea sp. NPDC050451 TaxID=3364364 RepID=UPI0037BDBFA7
MPKLLFARAAHGPVAGTGQRVTIDGGGPEEHGAAPRSPCTASERSHDGCDLRVFGRLMSLVRGQAS